MTDITIPPEALEAGARAYRTQHYTVSHEDAIRAAFLAIVAAWPGMSLHQQDINTRYSYFVLPLTEKTDDKA